MLLVQQAAHPTSIQMSFPKHITSSSSHRRIPSAPAVALPHQHVQVLPTKTPGLLSLSKPTTPPSARQPRHALPRQHKQKVQVQRKDERDSQGAPTTQAQSAPEGNRNRGRNAASRDKQTRNLSKPRAGHGGRARQPSPSPFTTNSSPEQASLTTNAIRSLSPEEAPVSVSLTPPLNVSTPSLVAPKAISSTTLSAPSGRLARRRNRASLPVPPKASTTTLNTNGANQNQTVPAPANANSARPKRRSQTPPAKARPVAVPSSKKQSKQHDHGLQSHAHTLPVSRSHPVIHRSVADVFPICDDNEYGLSDDDDDDADADDGRPSTPSPTGPKVKSQSAKQQPPAFDGNGPKSAPISIDEGVAKHYFPSPVPSPGYAADSNSNTSPHKRSPSVPSSTTVTASAMEMLSGEVPFNMDSLFGRAASARPRFDGGMRAVSMSASSNPNSNSNPNLNSMTPNRAANVNAAFNKYAASMFQNSPSPEHLPRPTFSLAKMKRALVFESSSGESGEASD